MENNGWVAIHRKLLESDIWEKPSDWLKIWLYILLKVNFGDKRYPRGTYYFRYCWVASDTNTSYAQVKHCVSWLRASRKLVTQKVTHGIIISVVNYDKYQDIKEDKSPTERLTKDYQKTNRSPNIYINKATRQQSNNNKYSGGEPPAPFSFNEKLRLMLDNKNKHIHIIGLYWEYKGFKLENEEQYKSAIKRDLRAGRNLIGYPDERIREVMFWLNGQDWLDWTLETVNKYINKDLNSIKR